MKKKLLSDKLHIFWICIVGISSYLIQNDFSALLVALATASTLVIVFIFGVFRNKEYKSAIGKKYKIRLSVEVLLMVMNSAIVYTIASVYLCGKSGVCFIYCAVSLLPNIPIMVISYKLQKAYNERSLQNVVGEDDLPKNNGL